MTKTAIMTLTLLVSGLAISACASSAVGAGSVQAETLSGVPTNGLSARALPEGACGMFLWTKAEPRQFIFFAEAGTGKADLYHQGKPTALVQTGSSGDIIGQFTTSQTYKDKASLSVSVTVKDGEMMDGGRRLKDGKIVTRDGDGWETIVPVLGIRACR